MKLYRAHSTYNRRATMSYFVESLITSHIFYSEYEVIKETEKGYWIDEYGHKRFVLKGGEGKRFAYINKQEALESFYYRKKRQIRILNSQLSRAKAGREEAKRILQEEYNIKIEW